MPNRIPDGIPSFEDIPTDGRNVFYIERPVNGERALLKWILGIASAVLVSAIFGAFSLNGQVSALSADVRNLKDQVSDLRHMVESYRDSAR